MKATEKWIRLFLKLKDWPKHHDEVWRHKWLMLQNGLNSKRKKLLISVLCWGQKVDSSLLTGFFSLFSELLAAIYDEIISLGNYYFWGKNYEKRSSLHSSSQWEQHSENSDIMTQASLPFFWLFILETGWAVPLSLFLLFPLKISKKYIVLVWKPAYLSQVTFCLWQKSFCHIFLKSLALFIISSLPGQI